MVTCIIRPMNLGNGAFLTAQWRYLAMLNYEVDPALLQARVPPGTELDHFDGRTFVSVVGFRFVQTRVRRIAVPWHQDFDEINLRFYVRRRADDGWRRGVVFVRELVPKPAIALVARLAYREPYSAVAMSHSIDDRVDGTDRSVAIGYDWKAHKSSGSIRVRAHGDPSPLVDGSFEQFIAEHYWGYGIGRARRTLEYEVRHDPWRVWSCRDATFAGEPGDLYGEAFARVLRDPPQSAFLAEGSPVSVFPARALT